MAQCGDDKIIHATTVAKDVRPGIAQRDEPDYVIRMRPDGEGPAAY